MGIVASIVSTFTRSLISRLPACVQDLAVSWHKNLNIPSAVSTPDVVEGVLDFDGVNDRVSLVVDLTGNQTVSFKCYLDSSRSTMAFVFKDNENDYLWFDYSNGEDFCVSIADGTLFTYTAPLSLNGQTVDVEIIKTTGALTSLSINGNIVSTSVVAPFTVDTDTYVGYYLGELATEEWSDGLLWDLDISSTHAYAGYPAGNTNTAWEDTIGVIDGFISGSPAAINVYPVSYYIKDTIGTRTDEVYYGQYLDATSGQINFYRTGASAGTFDYTDPSDGTLVEGVTIPTTGLYTVPANGICDIGVYPRTIGAVNGLLDWDGTNDSVTYPSAPNIQGNQVVKFKTWLKEDSGFDSTSLFEIPGITTDYFRARLFGGNLYIEKTQGAGVNQSYDITGLSDQILSFEVTKTSVAFTDIKLNGISISTITDDGFDAPSNFNIGLFEGLSDNYLADALVWDIEVESVFLVSGQPDGDQNSAWLDSIGALVGTVNGSPTTINIGSGTATTYTSFYPICERVGDVLHDVNEDSYHISIATPSWAESLDGSDYLNQCGFINKELSDALGYDWESIVNASAVTLNDDTLVPLGQWEYEALLDSLGDPVSDVSEDPIYAKENT